MMHSALEYLHAGWLYWGLVTIYAVTVLAIVGVIVSENRNPLKSLAWTTVLILLPVGGVVLYIFFGRSIKNTRMISWRKSRRLLRNEAQHHHANPDSDNRLADSQLTMATLAHSLTGAELQAATRLEVMSEGRKMFEVLMADLDKARHYINMQFYIIADDETGRCLADMLCRKAREGVAVRVIYDDIGSIHLSRAYKKRLREAGVDAHPFSRVSFPPFATRINWRNHRKITVIDGEVGYIGGMNIADRYLTGGKSFPSWRDCHLRVTGEGVASLQYSFAVDWSYMGRGLIEETSGKALPEGEGNAVVQLVTSGPTSRWSNVAMMMLRAIMQARTRIWIQTPYFLPTESLLRALQTAALARVDVRVMMPEHSDSTILTHASRSYIDECLKAGVKFYFYNAGMLHSKVMVIDNDVASVGSTNFDFRSFEHNFEANLFIYSREVNADLAHRFALDQDDSRRVVTAEWRRRPTWHKTRESILRLLSPVL